MVLYLKDITGYQWRYHKFKILGGGIICWAWHMNLAQTNALWKTGIFNTICKIFKPTALLNNLNKQKK